MVEKIKKINRFNNKNNKQEQNKKQEQEKIWKIAEEIESILDPESEHPLSGILPSEHPKWKKLLTEALSDEITLKRIEEIQREILEAIKKIKKGQVSFSFKIYTNDPEKRKKIEQWLTIGSNDTLKMLKISESNPAGFLGNGSTAEVFIIMSSGEQLCVKIIKNYESYNERDYNGNRIHKFLDKEGDILNLLKNFVVKDVATPEPLYYLSAPKFEGLIMETLKAVNLARVFEGHDEMPKNFNVNDYFDRLEKYFQALHNKTGIIHGDLAIRNLMVDKKTGLPRVIDFGKAKTKQDLLGTERDFDELAKKEMELLKILKQEVEEKYNNLLKNKKRR